MSCCSSNNNNKEDAKLDLLPKLESPKSCCKSSAAPSEPVSSCCSGKGVDWLLWGSLTVCAAALLSHFFFSSLFSHHPQVHHFSHSIVELLQKMWWGLALGVIAVGALGKVPRSFIQSLLGPGGTMKGILRATGAGLLLDLCNHGILLVAMKLYERGASLGQTLAFLIASPWNSLSLTLILVGLIGLKWTLCFILLSGVIAVITGYITDRLVGAGKLPSNPYHEPLAEGFHFLNEAKKGISKTKLNRAFWSSVVRTGLRDSRSIIRWILFGTVLAAGVRAFVDPSTFTAWFGPTAMGVALTLLAATIIEVCSEGSSPLAADLVNRAGAPGNGFAFLMAGAATDYTEIMALKETTKSWKMTFILPLLTLPQVCVIAVIINQLAS